MRAFDAVIVTARVTFELHVVIDIDGEAPTTPVQLANYIDNKAMEACATEGARRISAEGWDCRFVVKDQLPRLGRPNDPPS